MTSVSSATYTTTNTSYSVDRSGLTEDEAVTLKVQPMLDRIDSINTKISANETKISAYQTMQTLLQNLQTYAEYLQAPTDDTKDAFAFRSTTMTSSSSTSADSLLSASIADGTSTGTHEITVEKLAKAERLGSTTQSSKTTALSLTGAFTIGESGKTAATVSVTSSMSLSDIVSAINAQSSNTGVTASVIAVSTSSASAQYEMVLTATDTGLPIEMSTTSGTVLSDLGVTGSDGSTAADVLQSAQSAVIDVDGITGITRTSNDISDVLDGVTLSLTKADPSTTITMEITADTTSVENAITNFVSAYNSWRSFVSTNQTVDSSTNAAASDATLFGDSTLRNAATAIDTELNAFIGNSSLSAIGISFNNSNQLVIDTTTLETAISDNLSTVQQLFEYEATTSDSSLTLSSHGSATYSGSLSLTITSDGTNITGVSGTDSSGNAVSFTYSGNTIKGASGTLYAGLTFSYTGTASSSTISVAASQGIADSIYQIAKGYGNSTNGTVEAIVTDLQNTDTDLTTRASQIQDQANSYADYLQTQYANLESQISQANQTASLLQEMMSSSSS